MPDNPFIPSFGVSPLVLAGRDDALETIRHVSLNLARADYSRSTLVLGQRGVGKTVLLNQVEDVAAAAGWHSATTTATRGFLDAMVTDQLRHVLEQVRPDRHGRATASLGVNVPPVTAAVRFEEPPPTAEAISLREHIWQICEADPESGLLFTIDEVNSRARGDLEQFAAIYQHAIRAGLNVALVMCGIPASVSSLLSANRGPLTFLNRSRRVDLDILDFDTTRAVFEQTIRARGTRTASPEVIRAMAALSKGYPFLVQEIGNAAWDVHPDADEITLEDVREIAPRAIHAMNVSVLAPICNALAPRLRTALTVIAKSPGIRSSELAEKLGIPPTAIGELHRKLIDAAVIVRAGRGLVQISVPYLEEYLRELDGAADPDRRALDVRASFPDVEL